MQSLASSLSLRPVFPPGDGRPLRRLAQRRDERVYFGLIPRVGWSCDQQQRRATLPLEHTGYLSKRSRFLLYHRLAPMKRAASSQNNSQLRWSRLSDAEEQKKPGLVASRLNGSRLRLRSLRSASNIRRRARCGSIGDGWGRSRFSGADDRPWNGSCWRRPGH